MTKDKQFVSIIIPCRNEERFIGKCLDSVLSQDYPPDMMEVLIVDGESTDLTRDEISKYTVRYSFIRLLYNSKKIIPIALNIGVREAAGEVIVRMDAHTVYPPDYVSKLAGYLDECGVDNVGGVWVILPGAETLKAKAIAVALSSPFGVGNAYYRTGAKNPKLVDTVPFGCYRKDVFKKNGLFDEELAINEDAEFNHRLAKNGGKILLVPDVVSYYYSRDTYGKLSKMYLRYGYFRALTAKKIGGIIGVRQLVPSIFIGSLVICFFLGLFSGIFFFVFLLDFFSYLLADIIFSLRLSWKKKNILFFPALILTFFIIHFSYGIAYLRGIFDFIILRKRGVDPGEILLTR
ncbi:MAG: glycosyltransferase family 2 protein [Candidatus Omnitrophota bacterium]|jgi:glycosyltransferase involved in cell wall biosynthesis